MPRHGRPRTVDRPPCPACSREDRVIAHGHRKVAGGQKRVFRCEGCRRSFTPASPDRRADPALRGAVRRVRHETGASHRLLARALTTHLGVPVSHATVGAWCRMDDHAEAEGAACDRLSLLWALRQEIEAELSDG